MVGETMQKAVLDDRGRIVLPREVADELGLGKGDSVIFQKRGEEYVVGRGRSGRGRLEEIMDWNPPRSGKPDEVTPRDMKEIWKT
jgi:AbrB family looped-hinge helix DNA binding protein